MDDGRAEVDQETIACPECAGSIAIDRSLGPTFVCPYCNVEFQLDEPGNEDDDEVARRELERRNEEELDGLRIRQLAAGRRAAFRQRSYVIVALGGCIVAAVQLGWMTYQHVQQFGWEAKPIGYVLFAIACAVVAVMLGKQVGRMSRELAAHSQAVAAADADLHPDFSTLADGSERWKNLNDVK